MCGAYMQHVKIDKPFRLQSADQQLHLTDVKYNRRKVK